jgi:hypothetical protein
LISLLWAPSVISLLSSVLSKVKVTFRLTVSQ